MRPGLKILLFISICFLILNSAYVGAYAEPTLFYVTNVFAHLAAGSVIGMALLWAAWRERHSHLAFSIGAALCVLLALVSGGLIVYFGGTRPYALLVLLHGALGATALLTVVLAWRAWFGSAALDRANWKPLAVSFGLRNQHEGSHSLEFLYENGVLRAIGLPLGHLQAVALFGASLLLFQQPVVSEID